MKSSAKLGRQAAIIRTVCHAPAMRRRFARPRKKMGADRSAPREFRRRYYASMGEASGKRNLHLDKALLSMSSTSGSSKFLAIASSLTSR